MIPGDGIGDAGASPLAGILQIGPQRVMGIRSGADSTATGRCRCGIALALPKAL